MLFGMQKIKIILDTINFILKETNNGLQIRRDRIYERKAPMER